MAVCLYLCVRVLCVCVHGGLCLPRAGSPSNGRIGFSGEPTTPAASPAAAMYQSRLWSGAGMMGTSSSAATAKYEAEITGLRRTIARVERERDEARTRADAARTAVAALESGSERHSATAMAALSNARQSGDEVRRLQVKVSQLEEELRFAKLREADTARSFAEQVHSASRVGATGREAQRTLDATRVRSPGLLRESVVWLCVVCGCMAVWLCGCVCGCECGCESVCVAVSGCVRIRVPSSQLLSCRLWVSSPSSPRQRAAWWSWSRWLASSRPCWIP